MIFADSSNPIRCSKLADIIKCSAKHYMAGTLFTNDDEDDLGSGPAQTGSLTHIGVAEFHRLQDSSLDLRKGGAWDAIQQHANKFPQADVNEVRLFITPYMDDPRNINANCIKVEWEMSGEHMFTLPPHPLDPTDTAIYLRGTIDQIRLINGVPYIYDLKTGKKTGWEMLHDYAIQLAAYTYGARANGFPNAEPGFIIRAYGYRTRNVSSTTPDGVFFAAPFQSTDIENILETVRLHVALIRLGYVQLGPGPHCTYCVHGGLTNCIPKLKQLIESKRG